MPGMQSLNGLGIGAGIAQGLSSGMDAYLKTRSSLSEEAIKKRLANAQSIEAYSKLADAVGTDQAAPLAKNMGLISDPSQPKGYLPDPSVAAQPANQGTQNPNAGTSATAPNGLAPTVSTQIDDSKPNPSPASPQGPQGLVGGVSDLMRYPKAVRGLMVDRMNSEYKETRPQAQAELVKTQGEPTKEAMSAFAPQEKHITTMVDTHGALKNLIQKGDPKSSELMFQLLGRLNNPDSPRPNNELAEEVKNDPQFSSTLRDLLSEKKTGVVSVKTRAELGSIADNLMKNALDNHAAAAQDAEARWGKIGAKPGFTDLSNTLARAKSNMGTSRAAGPKRPGGLLSGGDLMGGASADTAASQAPSMADFAAEAKRRAALKAGAR